MSGRGVCTCATHDVEVVSGCLVETCVHVRHRTLRWCLHVRHETSRWCVHVRHKGGVYMYDTSHLHKRWCVHVRHKSSTQEVVCTCTTQVIYTRGGVYMYDTSHLHKRWCVHVPHKSSTQEVVCTCTTQVIYTGPPAIQDIEVVCRCATRDIEVVCRCGKTRHLHRTRCDMWTWRYLCLSIYQSRCCASGSVTRHARGDKRACLCLSIHQSPFA